MFDFFDRFLIGEIAVSMAMVGIMGRSLHPHHDRGDSRLRSAKQCGYLPLGKPRQCHSHDGLAAWLLDLPDGIEALDVPGLLVAHEGMDRVAIVAVGGVLGVDDGFAAGIAGDCPLHPYAGLGAIGEVGAVAAREFIFWFPGYGWPPGQITPFLWGIIYLTPLLLIFFMFNIPVLLTNKNIKIDLK